MKTFVTCASHSPLLYCYDKEPDDWDALQKACAEREAAIKDFDPDLVFAFGADHFNGFFLKLMLCFCIGLDAEAVGDIAGFARPPHRLRYAEIVLPIDAFSSFFPRKVAGNETHRLPSG